jgi:hypothetical protein
VVYVIAVLGLKITSKPTLSSAALSADASSSFNVFYRCSPLHPHEAADSNELKRVRVDLRFKKSDVGIRKVDKLREWVESGGLGT